MIIASTAGCSKGWFRVFNSNSGAQLAEIQVPYCNGNFILQVSGNTVTASYPDGTLTIMQVYEFADDTSSTYSQKQLVL